jgi:hypothetical protein
MPVNASPTFALQPTAYRQAISTNYISSANFNFANQYLPDIYEKEFERFGNRSITGFLRIVGAEMPCASDLIKWAEQGRLHTKWTACTLTNVSSNQTTLTITTANTGGSAGYPVQINQPMTPYPTNSSTLAALNQNIRVGQTLICQRENGVGSFHGRVASVTYQTSQTAAQATILLDIYEDTTGGSFPTVLSTGTWSVWIYGSEFRKGTAGMAESTQVFDSFFENNPIILKDKFTVTGSDMTQIGWVEVTTENGASGYLWYMKAEHEARLRFDDYLEASMLEAVPAAAANSGATTAGFKGTEGVFSALTTRGNIFSGGFPTSLVDFDSIVQRLDKQGAIEENAIFVNRAASFAIDDFLAAQNSYGTGGTSYGLFNNSEQMALNLGFRGFRRGYDFYKTDWKYLNDPTMRGQGTASGTVGGAINGMIVPVGSTNVYDEVMGQNAKRPFLHVRYRETDAESRKYKTWATGSAGGAATSDLDALEVHYLSERAVCTLGANNFFLFQS